MLHQSPLDSIFRVWSSFFKSSQVYFGPDLILQGRLPFCWGVGDLRMEVVLFFDFEMSLS